MKSVHTAPFWAAPNLQSIIPNANWLHRGQMSRSDDTHGVTIDSRQVQSGMVFAALPGENVDGHEFVVSAVHRGAHGIIVQRDLDPGATAQAQQAGAWILKVSSVTQALTDLARAYRTRLRQTIVIGITGSSGKTSTKDTLAAVLRSAGSVTASVKSFNNHLGVPLTLLNAKQDDRFVISEVGTNAPGEIAALGSIVQPDLVLITNVGRCHLEGLGSLEGVAIEKASLLDCMATDGRGFVFGDVPVLNESLRTKNQTITRFGAGDDCDVRLVHAVATEDGTSFELSDGTRWSLGLIGSHHAMNAAGVIALARHLGIDDATIAAALRTTRPAPGRFEPIVIADRIIFDDSYNANPESMRAAIDTFLKVTLHAEIRAIVLGDMLELGSSEQAEHAQFGRWLSQRLTQLPAGKCIVCTVGAAMAATAKALDKSSVSHRHWAQLTEDTLPDLIAAIKPADRVLVKASRRLGLERIVRNLTQQS